MKSNTAVTEEASAASIDEALETGFLPDDAHYRLTGEFKSADTDDASAASKKETEEKDEKEASGKEGASAATTTSEEDDADTAAASAAASTQNDEKKGPARSKFPHTGESRHAKLARENRELREENARIKAQATSQPQSRETEQVSQPATDGKATATPKPKIDDVDKTTGKPKYATYSEFEDAKDEWLRKDTLREIQETNAKTAKERELQQAEHTLAAGMVKKFETARAKYKDFDEVALNNDLVIPRGSVADVFLLDSEHAGEVAYYLGQHPELLTGFYGDFNAQTGKFTNKITPQQQFRKLMEIEATFAGAAADDKSGNSSAKPVTRAARPPNQVNGNATVGKDAVEQAVEDGDSEAYIREQNARELSRRKRK